ncbi:beta strand repeat-containing protein [Nostoc sp.]|uniref:beta strand repeat-containing protein n=1 Tax=Nostoc sp. TaxID=1180 RepID=UPI002FF92031
MSTFTVTNTNNSGLGSLRQAVLDANALSGKDIINFGGLFTDGLAHSISLTGSGLIITDDLSIQGTNPSLLTIKDNTADRVFDIGSRVTSAINGLTITNSYKNAGGGGAISNKGVLTLNSSTITGNSAKVNTTEDGYLLGEGGGIYNTGSLTVNYSTIAGNTAVGGGGIYNEGSLTVNHSIITDNTASRDGGGILSGSRVTIITVNYSTIAGNTVSDGAGGGIYNTGGLTVNHSTITENTANGGTGGSSTSYGTGGGIYNDASSLTVNYSTITKNTASSGGGIESSTYTTTTTPVTTVNHSIISGNTAINGGGIFIDLSSFIQTLLVSNSSISDNSARSNGGGIFVTGDSPGGITMTVSNSSISGNSALKGSGGGIYDGANGNGGYDDFNGITIIPDFLISTITITKSIISDNSAGANGGAIYNYSDEDSSVPNLTSSTITVTNSTISSNSAGANGGAIYNLGTITVTKSTISGNTALKGGGGIYNGGFTYPGYREADNASLGNLTVSNSTINNNHASTGSGIYNNGTLLVSYSTISNNYATDYGGGIYNSSFNEFGTFYPNFNDVGYTYPNSKNFTTMYKGLGVVTVSHSTISGNTAGSSGGGIYNSADQDFGKMIQFSKGTLYDVTITYNGLGIVTVSNSTISGNQAHFGSGIYNDSILTVGNSIIRHNKAFGIELSSGKEESGKGGGIYNSNSSYATATVDYSTIACNFDTPEKDSNKVIKSDDLVGKFIAKYHDNRVGNLSGSTFSYS